MFTLLNVQNHRVKHIDWEDYSVYDLDRIYSFYKTHKDYLVIIDGDIQ